MNSVDLLTLVIAVLLASLTAYLAKGRGRSPALWFLIGMLFGIFALIALFLIPMVKPEGEKRGPVTIVAKPEAVDDAFSLKSWFYLDAQRAQVGPIQLHALQELWKNQAIMASTYVWCEGMENWKKIADLPDLAERLSQ